jgi:hypothetical protein
MGFVDGRAGLPYLEPAFATVAEAPGREVHGLACAVTPQQWERIQLTETGYDVVEVTCNTYGEGEGDAPLLARTLVFPAQRRRRGLRPSKRYAADHHSEPSSWSWFACVWMYV